MDKKAPEKFFKAVQKSAIEHSPEILIGIGITSLLSTTVLAVRATPKALQLIEEAKRKERKDKLSPIDTVKATWKCYIPAAISGAVGVGCIIGANSVHSRRTAAFATAYKLSETAFAEYKEKVIETIGEKKEQVIEEKVAKEQIDKNPIKSKEVIVTEKGNTLFLDPVSHRYFTSDIEKIRRVVNELNNTMIHDLFGYISLNDFYDEIGLPRTSVGDDLGWNLENGHGLLDIDYSAQLAEDDRPCIVLNYTIAPKYGYNKYR